jgi:hypothetical protein
VGELLDGLVDPRGRELVALLEVGVAVVDGGGVDELLGARAGVTQP